jgi:hypothetical protein
MRTLLVAAAMAAAGPAIAAPLAAPERESFPQWKHDPERMAAAESKRARKNAKRLRETR